MLLFREDFGGTYEDDSSACSLISDILSLGMLSLLLEAEFLPRISLSAFDATL